MTRRLQKWNLRVLCFRTVFACLANSCQINSSEAYNPSETLIYNEESNCLGELTIHVDLIYIFFSKDT